MVGSCPLHGPRPHDGLRCRVHVLDDAGDRVPCGFLLLGCERHRATWHAGEYPEVRERPKLRGMQVDALVSGASRGLDDQKIAEELRRDYHLDISAEEVGRLLDAFHGR